MLPLNSGEIFYSYVLPVLNGFLVTVISFLVVIRLNNIRRSNRELSSRWRTTGAICIASSAILCFAYEGCLIAISVLNLRRLGVFFSKDISDGGIEWDTFTEEEGRRIAENYTVLTPVRAVTS